MFCFLFLSLSGHNGDNGGVIILFINFLAGGIAANLVLVVVFDGGGDGHNMDMEQDLDWRTWRREKNRWMWCGGATSQWSIEIDRRAFF